MNNKKGFTLIELLVVIFIIGLLASVVLVGLGTFRARGRDARRIADLRSTQNILELYYAKSGQYPNVGSWSDLKNELVGASIGVSAIPNDPSSGEDYQYGTSASNQSYALGAKLEDVDHPVLRDDVDGGGGSNYGVNCDDPVYCVKF
ncbi:MAG: type II secretion system protein [Patescibacteria group bacterium]